MKKRSKILLIILAILAVLVGVVSYFLPLGLLIHTVKITKGDFHAGSDHKNDTIHFVVNEENRMLFEAVVNGETDTVMYDSGVSVELVSMYTPSTRPKGMKFYRHRVTSADEKSRIKMTTLPVKIEADMVVSEGLGLAVLTPEPSPCDESYLSKYNLVGFQGLDVFRYMIDFTNRQIYFISSLECIDTTEFIPIKCKMKRDVLFVYPVVNGVEYECIFDTGNGAAGLLLKDEQRVANPAENDLVYEGSYGMAIGGYTDKQRYVHAPQEKFGLFGDDCETDALYVNSIEFNNLGFKAISKFDWIISHEGGLKVYVRPHANDTVKPVERLPYRVVVDEGKLKILTRLIDGNEMFKVGDRIVSVNGEKITEENICYYFDLLTENTDWSEFEIKVK